MSMNRETRLTVMEIVAIIGLVGSTFSGGYWFRGTLDQAKIDRIQFDAEKKILKAQNPKLSEAILRQLAQESLKNGRPELGFITSIDPSKRMMEVASQSGKKWSFAAAALKGAITSDGRQGAQWSQLRSRAAVAVYYDRQTNQTSGLYLLPGVHLGGAAIDATPAKISTVLKATPKG